MAATWALTTCLLAALLIIMLLLTARHSGPRAWTAWALVLSSQAPDRRRYEQYAADLADELAALNAALRLARRQSERGEERAAVRAVEAASRHVTRHIPALSERLATWREAARVLSAIYPLPHLSVMLFHAWRLRGAAIGDALARPMLDAAHRLSLRVYVLLYGLQVVLRGFARQIDAPPPTTAGLRRRLEELESLGGDLATLQGASLDIYKALLISLHDREGSPTSTK